LFRSGNVPEIEIINGSVCKGVATVYQTSLYSRVAAARKSFTCASGGRANAPRRRRAAAKP